MSRSLRRSLSAVARVCELALAAAAVPWASAWGAGGASGPGPATRMWCAPAMLVLLVVPGLVSGMVGYAVAQGMATDRTCRRTGCRCEACRGNKESRGMVKATQG
jgi:hypothetical protein